MGDEWWFVRVRVCVRERKRVNESERETRVLCAWLFFFLQLTGKRDSVERFQR